MSKQEMLEKLIAEHENEECNCNFEDESFCLAGAYLNGCITLEETLLDIE